MHEYVDLEFNAFYLQLENSCVGCFFLCVCFFLNFVISREVDIEGQLYERSGVFLSSYFIVDKKGISLLL